MKTLARRTVVGLLARIGRTAETVARHAGEMTLLAWRVAVATLTGRVALRDVLIQLQSIGVGSIPLVGVTAILSGVVTSQQGGYQFTSSIPLYVLGSVVTSSVDPRARPRDDRLRPHRPGRAPASPPSSAP